MVWKANTYVLLPSSPSPFSLHGDTEDPDGDEHTKVGLLHIDMAQERITSSPQPTW